MAGYALITGASEGIGRAVARALAGAGYNLVLTARNEQKLKTLRTELLKASPQVNVLVLAYDLGATGQLHALVDDLHAAGTAIDILVNNLGIYQPESILAEKDEAFGAMMQLNVFVPYFLSKILGQKMVDRKAGYIFGIVSIAGKTAIAGSGSYSVSKFASYGLFQNLREELRGSGVKVTAILPGSTLTSSWTGTQIGSDRFVQPEDVASAVLNCLKMSSGANVDEITITPLNFDAGA